MSARPSASPGVAQVAEQLDAVHAQHRRQRMRLSPLAAALRTRWRNACLQALPGGQAVHPLRKDLAARPVLLAIALEAGKGQLPKALHVVIPQKKGVAQNGGRTPDAQCRAHISGCIQRFLSQGRQNAQGNPNSVQKAAFEALVRCLLKKIPNIWMITEHHDYAAVTANVSRYALNIAIY